MTRYGEANGPGRMGTAEGKHLERRAWLFWGRLQGASVLGRAEMGPYSRKTL